MTRLTCALFAAAALIAGCGSAGGAGHTTDRRLAATLRGGPNPAAAYPGGPAVVRLSEAEFTITPGVPRVSGTLVVAAG